MTSESKKAQSTVDSAIVDSVDDIGETAIPAVAQKNGTPPKAAKSAKPARVKAKSFKKKPAKAAKKAIPAKAVGAETTVNIPVESSKIIAATKTVKKASSRAGASTKSIVAKPAKRKPGQSKGGQDKTELGATGVAKTKVAKTKGTKIKPVKTKLDKIKPGKTEPVKTEPARTESGEAAKILDSQVVYQGPLFRVLHDRIIEPGGRESRRDIIRHNGSVVILAVEPGKRKKNPWIVIERQYRHAAGQFLWELPAGKLDAGEKPMDGAKRELAEETGYQAKKWSPLVEYYASPGFLGESMKVFLAEGLIAGDAHPEEDEHIDFRLVKLSELLEMVDKGKIIDGKTLTSVLLYARLRGLKLKKG